MVQLWDTYTGLEKEGQLLPAQSFGIHGLWYVQEAITSKAAVIDQ
jgi:hypothetical protein